MNNVRTKVTQAGFDDLKNEHIKLTTIDLPAVVKEIKRAKELGDLSENGAYHAARDKQSFLVGRINELDYILKNIDIVEVQDTGVINLGTIADIEVNKKKMTYTLVSEHEADLAEGKISIKSPIGKALEGKKVDDIVTIDVPSGEMKLKVLNIK